MEIVDLTHTLRAGMPVYPGDRPVSLTREKALERDHYTAFALSTGLHAGTHVDLPMHLLADDRTADRFAPEGFIGRGILLDVRGEKRIGRRQEFDAVRQGDVVLLYTGFDARFGEAAYFDAHPVVEPELAEFFARRRIRMLGMDMPSPDAPPFPVHRCLLSQGIWVLENLTRLGALLGRGAFEVAAVPLKLAAEASPVRAYARIG